MLKIIRLYGGMPQWELAKTTGVAQSFISKIETNRMGSSNIKDSDMTKIAKALGVSEKKLFKTKRR